MKFGGYEIRPIQPQDNAEIARVIREVLPAMGAPMTGTAFADPSLDAMFENYSNPRSRYWVVVGNGRVWGGGGFAPLDGGDLETCELQKMYFKVEVRGLGLGQVILGLTLETAKDFGFSRCYLETMPYMQAALSLYHKNGFLPLEQPMGCTGHTACQVWMAKTLV
ncbi:MAG: hypothetical protein RLZZ241_2440 [Bacteroidota bacterium]|jgi:putative acetyltransferase